MSEALSKALHNERAESNTRNVDCWACEAARSKVIGDLVESLQRALASASHTNAVLERAMPDDAARTALWREHWREQLAARRTEQQETSA